MDLFSIVLPIIYTLFGLGLIWFIIELVVTIRKVRGEALSVIKDVKPTLDNIEGIVSDIQPAISKIDPLMDRVTLTIDSVNLEMIRVDEILETVTNITNSVDRTTNAIGNVTSAPADIITSVTSKIRSKISPKYSSNDVAAAGLIDGSSNQNPIASFADATIDAASEAIKEQQGKVAERKAHQKKVMDQLNQKNEDLANAAQKLSGSIIGQADADAAAYAPADSMGDAPEDATYDEVAPAVDHPADFTNDPEATAQAVSGATTQDVEDAVDQQTGHPVHEDDVHSQSMGAHTEHGFESQVDESVEDLAGIDAFESQDLTACQSEYQEKAAKPSKQSGQKGYFEIHPDYYDPQGLEEVGDEADVLVSQGFEVDAFEQPRFEPSVIDQQSFEADAEEPPELAVEEAFAAAGIAEEGLDPVGYEPVASEAIDLGTVDVAPDLAGFAPVEVESETADFVPADVSFEAEGFAPVDDAPELSGFAPVDVPEQGFGVDPLEEGMLEPQLSEEEIDALITQEALHEVFGDRLLSGEMTEEDLFEIQEMLKSGDPDMAFPASAQLSDLDAADGVVGHSEPIDQAAEALAQDGVSGNPRFMRVASASHSGSVRATAANMSAVDVTAVEPTAMESTTTFLIPSDGNGSESGGIPISDIKIG